MSKAVTAVSLLTMLLLCLPGCPASGPFWVFPGHAGSLDNERAARAQRLITLGRYSERDGDTDMLGTASGRRQQPEMANADSSSIWGFAPNFGTARAQHDWPSNWQPPPPNNGGGQQQSAAARPNWPVSASTSQQQSPSPSPSDQIARPLPAVHVPIQTPFIVDSPAAAVDRFASGPPAGSQANRIVLPPNYFERLGQRIATENGRTANNQFVGTGADVGRPSPPGERQSSQQPPQTRILTNERIPSSAAPKPAAPIVPVRVGLSTHQISGGPVPALPDFRHEDIRPEEDGERLGPQGKFSGPTNQYKEDWGRELTRKEANDGRSAVPLSEFGPRKLTSGDGPASKFIGAGISPLPEGAQVLLVEDGQMLPTATPKLGGQIRPYVNGPEEITGSRWRNIDEHFNALHGGNRGRGPNRYVKVDLLNEKK